MKPGTFVDGFRRPSKSAIAARKTTASSSARTTGMTPHHPEAARTLMRSAVKKPDITAPSKLKAQSRTDILAAVPKQAVVPKASHTAVDAKRLKKATQTIKHPQISRYGSASSLIAIQRPVPTPAQDLHASPPHTNTIDRIQSSISQVSSQPKAAQVVPVAAAPVYQPKTDIFTLALANASSHKQVYEPAVKAEKRQRRGAMLVTSALCLMMLAGAMVYLNAPALSLKVASVKAGVSARLPGYRPAGFNFGALSYGKGNVTVSYASATDTNQRYDITQRTSNWDSQTLLNNFVSGANSAYQTYQQAGRTVYMYGNNTATWVDSGIWYTVNGNTALSREQILDLAGSL